MLSSLQQLLSVSGAEDEGADSLDIVKDWLEKSTRPSSLIEYVDKCTQVLTNGSETSETHNEQKVMKDSVDEEMVKQVLSDNQQIAGLVGELIKQVRDENEALKTNKSSLQGEKLGLKGQLFEAMKMKDENQRLTDLVYQ